MPECSSVLCVISSACSSRKQYVDGEDVHWPVHLLGCWHQFHLPLHVSSSTVLRLREFSYPLRLKKRRLGKSLSHYYVLCMHIVGFRSWKVDQWKTVRWTWERDYGMYSRLTGSPGLLYRWEYFMNAYNHTVGIFVHFCSWSTFALFLSLINWTLSWLQVCSGLPTSAGSMDKKTSKSPKTN